MADEKEPGVFRRVLAGVGMAAAMGGAVAGATPPDMNPPVDSSPGLVDPAGFDPSDQGSWNDLAEGILDMVGKKKEEEEEEINENETEGPEPPDPPDPPAQIGRAHV